MNTSYDLKKSIRRLVTAIAPPQQPIGLGAKTLTAEVPPLPSDVFLFVDTYGSGVFESENGGLFLTVLNPYEQQYWTRQTQELDAIKRLVDSQPANYIPYRLFPDQPGLLLWGYGEGRKHFFWLTEGEPECWPVIAMHDLEICTRFDMSMVRFLEQLLCGDMDCDFIGGVDTPNNRIDSNSIKYIACIQPI